MKIPENIANKIYDILAEIGASESMRKAFVYDHGIFEDQDEWRFQGKLGFGGKFWNDWSYIKNKPEWIVTCYSEDLTPERKTIMEETNKKLQILINEFYS